MINPHSPESASPALEIRDMLTLYDALDAAGDALLGIINQPRCSRAARTEIDKFGEALCQRRYAIVESMRAAQPSDPEEFRQRAEVLMRFFFEDNECDVTEFREVAASISGAQS